ncbi:hypothetical protein X770_31135 [Mesorhizobium sp. LSJC269B00]|nr:hypothetical protein X770_31135 [Mesorhizobium sp. LSJC269B00]ESZ26142.1 hypothetical protein X733_30240 [Mesorhizobium sp. L2C067A000]
MGAKLFVPNWDHAAAGKLRLGLIKGLGAGIGNGDRWSLCAKPQDQHHGCPILQNLTHTTPRDKGCWAVVAPICSGMAA